ncbi:MAG: hypothetical protein AAFY65_01285 [Pseudomonadota bacterium]
MVGHDIIDGDVLTVDNCVADCPCQHVHMFIGHDRDTPFAHFSCPPDVARKIAKDLLSCADEADLQQARVAGQVS